MTIQLAILCGGPSNERGISLNSARSFLDHISSFEVDLTLLYINPHKEFYRLTPGQLYSNTPSDFDFKLVRESAPLSNDACLALLRTADLVIPILHGIYGEDGTLQQWLERENIPFLGASSHTCHQVFNKHRARQQLQAHGFPVLPSLLIKTRQDTDEILPFWTKHKLNRAIIKPTESGSSLGVTYAPTPSAALDAAHHLFNEGFQELILEPYCEETEFTVCVFETRKGTPVALLPIEIELKKGEGNLFDYRKKYLPTEETRYHCPPRFSPSTMTAIRKEAADLFKKLRLRDFARFDGWLTQKGELLFSDFNPISGMEQNSFLFQQAAQLEMTHADVLQYVVGNALQRIEKGPLKPKTRAPSSTPPLYVLMGGDTAERQVSLLSGTNVWLKLKTTCHVTPCLFDGKETLWELPYAYTLHHTVDEILERLARSGAATDRLHIANEIRQELGLPLLQELPSPIQHSLDPFLERAKKENAFLFLGLHGGAGEDGTLQRKLEEKGIRFNGSREKASKLCMDKHETALAIGRLQHSSILPLPQRTLTVEVPNIPQFWEETRTLFQKELGAPTPPSLLIKPRHDGCSAGVVRLASAKELALYLEAAKQQVPTLPPGTFQFQRAIVEMGRGAPFFLLEPFIETDLVEILNTSLCHHKKSGWCEMTIVVLEKKGLYRAMNPSITVAQHGVLSLEEKFQGGTGINLTPPPVEILSTPSRIRVQAHTCIAAKALGIENYARLDLFVECETGAIRVIEANTLPALTPSTVLYQQAMVETPPLTPQQLLFQLIS